ncbi:NPCBM/NEW2 domain-containing protein [Clostridium sp.]|uniref:NPCBM/NEW2 domain-containing protein n=1 Tax=Clostridium sp. TaxID=1506 RepID=UPI003F2D8910
MKNKYIVALVLMTLVSNFSISHVPVFASSNSFILEKNKLEEEKDIAIKKFGIKDFKELSEYNDIFKKDVKSITNNGGQYWDRNIEKAIDNNLETFWETGRPNSKDFKNEITVTFEDIESINRIVYSGRRDGTGAKGFPLEFEIYSSLTDGKDDFVLVGKGKYKNNPTEDVMEFKLKEATNFKRLKIKFINSYDNWSSASELWFYGEDTTLDSVSNLFANGIYTELKEEYNDIDKLLELREKSEIHPLADRLLELVDMAIEIYSGENVVQGVVMTPTRNGNMQRYVAEAQLHGMSTNIQPTGVYGVPGDRITVFVDVDENDPCPSIVFTQVEGHYGNWYREYTLNPGINEIVVPEIYDEAWTEKTKKGGPIYVVNPYTKEEQKRSPMIRIEGGEKYPIYYDNGNEEEFLNFLYKYNEALQEDDERILDLVEIVTDSIILTGTTTGAYEAYFEKGVTPEETTNFWVDTMNEIFRFYGIDGSKENNKKENIRETIRLMQPYGAMYAAGGHIGVQKDVMTTMLVPEMFKDSSWGFIHEIGHKLDQRGRTWGEITNNVVSNHMQQYFNGIDNDRVPYEDLVYPKVVSDDEPVDFNEGDLFESLGMLWQLQLIDDNYWSKLQQLYRDRIPSVDDNEQLKRDTFIEYTCEILGINLTEFFERHGFSPSEDTIYKLESYKDTGKKYWYLNSLARNYNGTGIQDSHCEIREIETVDNGKKSVIKLSIESKANGSDILGYEIIRNGEKIAFTTNSIYYDSNVESGQVYDYKVIAYGKDLSTSKESSVKSQSSDAPIFLMEDGITVLRNSEFNPLKNLKAVDYKGKDISSNIKIKFNNVITDFPGIYKVIYEVEDSNKVKSQKTFKVNVVDGFDYVSDKEWKSANTGWGTVNKNKSVDNNDIRVNKYSEDITYEKGIGTHANSTIIYDVSDENYDYFTSYVGVDKEVDGSVASVTFEVWVDGVKKYNSGKMIAGSPAEYVNVDIKGAKEVKLVVTDAGDGAGSDHADWADAKFIKEISKENIILSKPNNLKSEEVSGTSIKLSWDEPDNILGLREYVVYKDGKEYETLPINTTEIVFDGLRINSIYGFKVVARYVNGNESKPVSINIRTSK